MAENKIDALIPLLWIESSWISFWRTHLDFAVLPSVLPHWSRARAPPHSHEHQHRWDVSNVGINSIPFNERGDRREDRRRMPCCIRHNPLPLLFWWPLQPGQFSWWASGHVLSVARASGFAKLGQIKTTQIIYGTLSIMLSGPVSIFYKSQNKRSFFMMLLLQFIKIFLIINISFQ